MVNFNEIAQDSPCARVYRQGRYSRLEDFFFCVADAATGLRRASKNKETWTTKYYSTVCFSAVELKNSVKNSVTSYQVRDFSKNARNVSYDYCSSMEEQDFFFFCDSTRKNKSNDLEPQFPT